MWALIVDGSINRFFKTPTAFKHPTTGIQYPRNWLTLASDSEKASVGFIEVTYSGSHKDGEYYHNADSAAGYDASKGTVVITRSSTARNLADLKTKKKSASSGGAYSSLQTTDWYVIPLPRKLFRGIFLLFRHFRGVLWITEPSTTVSLSYWRVISKKTGQVLFWRSLFSRFRLN